MVGTVGTVDGKSLIKKDLLMFYTVIIQKIIEIDINRATVPPVPEGKKK